MIESTIPPLNTKENYYLAIQILPEIQWKQILQDLLDDRIQWVLDHELVESETGTNDSSNKVITVPYTGGLSKRYQYILQDNPNSRMERLGFTISEINSLLNS